MPDQNDMFQEPAPRPSWAVFDTETSGLFDFSKPADAPGQPRLAALAMIWTTPDLQVKREHAIFIKPEGWYMQPGAQKVNGLSQEFLMARGRPVIEALDLYESAVREGYVFAAYNSQFDTKVMRAEFRRAGKEDLFEKVKNVCVMRKNVGVCKIPYANGKPGYKFPKLAEAMAHWKLEQRGAHTSLGDARSALALLRCLDSIGIDLTPEVHYAKNRPTAPGPEGQALAGDDIPNPYKKD
jgi:DNA polymerase III subunit epsilon